MKRAGSIGMGIGAAGLILVGAVIGYYTMDRYPRRFAVVVPGKIYRSGQPNSYALERVVEDTGIRTIVNLRGEKVFKRDDRCQQEEYFAGKNAIKVVVIEFKNPPTEENIKDLLGVLDAPQNYPILIHCKRGVDRTGVAVAVYRMERMGWTTGQAMREMLTNDFASDLRDAGSSEETIFVAKYKPKHPAPGKTP